MWVLIEKKENRKGHVWIKKWGQVDMFGYEHGYHSGPRCKKCKLGFCINCIDLKRYSSLHRKIIHFSSEVEPEHRLLFFASKSDVLFIIRQAVIAEPTLRVRSDPELNFLHQIDIIYLLLRDEPEIGLSEHLCQLIGLGED